MYNYSDNSLKEILVMKTKIVNFRLNEIYFNFYVDSKVVTIKMIKGLSGHLFVYEWERERVFLLQTKN